MAALQKRWAEVRSELTALDEAAKQAKGSAYNKLRSQMKEKLFAWVEELSKVRVLDPACGSGNFLYLALKRMLDLWKEAYVLGTEHGFLPHPLHPSQLYGIEINVYAHELASVVVWIGYLQWLKDNGMGRPTDPILQSLTNIQHRDAILAFDATGEPVKPEWPETEFIIVIRRSQGATRLGRNSVMLTSINCFGCTTERFRASRTWSVTGLREHASKSSWDVANERDCSLPREFAAEPIA